MKKPSKKVVIISVLSLGLAFFILTIVSLMLINSNKAYVVDSAAEIGNKLDTGKRVAMVLGGGIGSDNWPTDVVVSRLDASVELFEQGAIDKIIVSGDNRFEDYNEPEVMRDYLVNGRGVPPEAIQMDNAGRSTYESCERAKHVFQLDQVVLVSQRSHLPRALYLCRSFGINALGYPASSDHSRLSQSLRELAANVKAVLNVYVLGEPTVLGEPIPL